MALRSRTDDGGLGCRVPVHRGGWYRSMAQLADMDRPQISLMTLRLAAVSPCIYLCVVANELWPASS
jgi:hypothetical protein